MQNVWGKVDLMRNVMVCCVIMATLQHAVMYQEEVIHHENRQLLRHVCGVLSQSALRIQYLGMLHYIVCVFFRPLDLGHHGGCRQRMEALKACIKRKHVAFQLFKAWYWDAFDHDVQVRTAALAVCCR